MSPHTFGADPPVSANGLGCPTTTGRMTGHGTSTTMTVRPFPRVRS